MRLVGQAGEHDRRTLRRGFEREPERPQHILDDVRDEMFVADLELADPGDRNVSVLCKNVREAQQNRPMGRFFLRCRFRVGEVVVVEAERVVKAVASTIPGDRAGRVLFPETGCYS